MIYLGASLWSSYRYLSPNALSAGGSFDHFQQPHLYPTNMRPTTAGQEYTRNVLSSLPLQIILYFNTWYSITFFIMNVLLFSYKGWKYYYSTGTLIWEFVMIFLIALIDTARVFFCFQGKQDWTVGSTGVVNSNVNTPFSWTFILFTASNICS